MFFEGCKLPLILIAETSSLEITMSEKLPIQKWNICLNNQGFTFIEIMVAMVIFVIGILSVAALQTKATKSNISANRSTRAFTWCSDRMEVLMSLPYTDPNLVGAADPGVTYAPAQTADGIDNDYDGQIDEANENGDISITWNVRNNDGVTEAPPLPEFTKSITVRVTWQTPMGQEKTIILRTVRARNATAS
jgi:prepilin-type N-terminal cleavage/methylation domain-containing protein